MRLLIQRVTEASVEVNKKTISAIDQGLLIFVGIEEADNAEDIEWLVKKVTALRIFNDADKVMNLSVEDINGEILVVSQFTLHASTRKGNRPSYINAAKPENALKIYDRFCDCLSKKLGKKVQTGIFGADMQVKLINNGPVTIWIDSKTRE